jgi:hypothetical protein
MHIPTNGEHWKNTVQNRGERIQTMQVPEKCGIIVSVKAKELGLQVETLGLYDYFYPTFT